MIPSVFISSTVDDLRHVRDAVRATVEEIGFRPVMSEYGEIGYMGGGTAEDACYKAVSECQIMVLIVGKHYGSRSRTAVDQTITELEFDEGIKHCEHIITLVEKEVLEYKKVFDVNSPEKELTFPEMNEPAKTFSFISRISQEATKNAIVSFSNASDIHRILKLQFAMLVYDLLVEKSSTTRASLNDILSEVKTLREAMSRGDKPDAKFLAAIRFLIDDENIQLRDIVKLCVGGLIESAIPRIIADETFEDFLNGSKVECVVDDAMDDTNFIRVEGFKRGGTFYPPPLFSPESGEKPKVARYMWSDSGKLVVNQTALDYYKRTYATLKRHVSIAM